MDVYHVQLRINALKLTLEELTEGIERWEKRDTIPTWMFNRHNIINQAHPTRLRYIVGCEPLPEGVTHVPSRQERPRVQNH